MFIKKIIISGFRSYKYCLIDDLCPGLNVIVGSNGSGKSNLVMALEFVLTQNYNRLNEQQRLLLMCNQNQSDNGSAKTIEAFVELHFDNEDKFFPVNEPLVIIKRQITRTNDNFFINGKLAKNDELMAFLESGGFSRDNSYFIVKQGLVTDIATSNPKKILDILRCMSGAQKFDQKKIEALQLIKENEQLVQQIGMKIQLMEDELSMLNIDTEAIQRYERLSKIKKYLTSRIKQTTLEELQQLCQEHQHEFAQSQINLEQYQQNLSQIQECLEEKKQQRREIRNEILDLKTKFESSKLLMETLMNELSDLRQQRQSYDQQIVNNDLEQIGSLKQELAEEDSKLKDKIEELKDISKVEKELQDKLKSLASKRMNYLNWIQLVQSTTGDSQEQDLLIHDRFLQPLNEQIQELQMVITNQREETLPNLKSKKSELMKLMKKSSDERKSRLQRSEPLKQELADLVFQQKSNKLELCKIMSQLTELQKESISIKNDVKEMENRLDIFGSIMKTKHSIQQVLQSFQSKLSIEDDGDDEQRQHAERIINGYHGQVIDFIELVKPVNYAMEVLLKNNLFYHVVSDESIAIELLNEISRLKLFGSFNFLAGNRLPLENESSIGRGLDKLCQPLFNCISNKQPNNELIENVLRHIFNGLYIGRSFQDCWTLFQKSRNCDFATLEGEMIDHSGVIRKVRKNQLTKFELYQKLLVNQRRLKEIHEKIEQLESDRDRILNENLEAHRQETMKKQELSELRDWIQNQNEEEIDSNESVMAKKLEQIEKEIEFERNCLCSNETRMSCLVEEKNFWQQKSKSDPDVLQSEIQDLNEQIEAVESEIHHTSHKRTLTEKLIQDLKLSTQKLKTKIMQIEYDQSNQQSAIKNCEKFDQFEREWNEKIEKLHRKISEFNQTLTTKSQSKCELASEIDHLEQEWEKAKNELETLQKSFQIKEDERKNLDSQIQNIMVDIEQAGLFSNDFIRNLDSQYRNLNTIGQMNKAVKDLNRQLNRLIPGGKINHDLLEAYDEHHQAIDHLKREKEIQIRNAEKIYDLIRIVERRKNEIIMRTYKQVNVNFKEIFKQFVPGGVASLQFITRNVDSSMESSSSSTTTTTATTSNGSNETSIRSETITDPSSSSSNSYRHLRNYRKQFIDSVDAFVGIEIVVSFQENVEPIRDLLSLSSGQKTLVSMAFVLALQQVDPTPFYIFDELDQNLDPQSRQLIAQIIHDQISPRQPSEQQHRQFIITTFKTQLVEHSDRCYGVKYVNGISQVKRISKISALEFLSTIPETKIITDNK
ncbi:Structural maintenance of chromosomes protein 3 [Dermatophagoides pteronyssinus]|uniref:Structural maintenance of chromosomes protein n=1 Tax=Dermatophagoides pteronyssinus TaxID=6956 RepID=A0ABQ8IX72_DERPT|nr:Structural maintenance of chromosomes protein 3 [Dermatophagoides pteronyssinus]